MSEKDARKKGDDFIACNEISSNSYSYKTFDEVFALIVKAKKIKGTKEKSILREIQTYVVCNKKGEIVRETYVNREFHKILDAVKIKVDKGGGVNILHDSFGLFLANNNFTPENIACILGFAKESSTENILQIKNIKSLLKNAPETTFSIDEIQRYLVTLNNKKLCIFKT